MVTGLLGNESSDSNRFTLVTPKSENDVRLQATLGNQNPTGLPVGVVRKKVSAVALSTAMALSMALPSKVNATSRVDQLLSNMSTRQKITQMLMVDFRYVVSYSFLGESRKYPIVEYAVDGVTYKTKKKYKGIKSIKASGIPLPVKSNAFEDEKGYLHIKSGAIVNVRQIAEKLWPINSKMIVYYNPDNPKICFVDRPIYNSFASKMFIMGSVVIIISIIVFFLMQL